MDNLKDQIPPEFYRGELDKPIAGTVGALREKLAELPADLPVEQGFGVGCQLVVYNINHENAHLEIEEVD